MWSTTRRRIVDAMASNRINPPDYVSIDGRYVVDKISVGKRDGYLVSRGDGTFAGLYFTIARLEECLGVTTIRVA